MLSGYRPGKTQSSPNRRAIWSCMEALGWTKIEFQHTAAGGGGDTYYFPPGVTQQNGYRCHSTEHKDGQPAPLGKAGRAYYKNMGAVVRRLRKQHGMQSPGPAMPVAASQSPRPVEVQPQPAAQALSPLPAEASPAEPADQPPVGDWEVDQVQRWAASQRGQEWPRIVEKLKEHEVDGDMLLACKRRHLAFASSCNASRRCCRSSDLAKGKHVELKVHLGLSTAAAAKLHRAIVALAESDAGEMEQR